MFCDSHQFHVGVTHFQHIVRKAVSKLFVIIKSLRVCFTVRMFFPGTRMHFIDKHGLLCLVLTLSFLHPFTVFPGISLQTFYHRSGSRSYLTMYTKRIGFHNFSAVPAEYTVFVPAVFQHTGNEQSVNTQRFQTLHHMGIHIPSIKITHHADFQCIRCPDSKVNALFTISFCQMSSQLLVDLIMCSHTEQILIIFGYFKYFFCLFYCTLLLCFYCFLCLSCHICTLSFTIPDYLFSEFLFLD